GSPRPRRRARGAPPPPGAGVGPRRGGGRAPPRHVRAVALPAPVGAAGADASAPRHLGAIVRSAAPPRFPVELATDDAGADADWGRLEQAVVRAGRWLAAFPSADLRFDAAIVLTMIRH